MWPQVLREAHYKCIFESLLQTLVQVSAVVAARDWRVGLVIRLPAIIPIGNHVQSSKEWT